MTDSEHECTRALITSESVQTKRQFCSEFTTDEVVYGTHFLQSIGETLPCVVMCQRCREVTVGVNLLFYTETVADRIDA